MLGLENIPFTADSMLYALQKLSDLYQIPLFVYGSPAKEGFSVLLELFEISPMGGREFYVEDGKVKFDKISDKAENYLVYVNQIYQKGYIPSDFLVLSEYSGIGMLAHGKSAMAVFPSMEIAQEAIQTAEKMGRQVALTELPVDHSCTETNIYARLTGLISWDYPDAETAKRFLAELQSVLKEINKEENIDVPVERYPLFSNTGAYRRKAFDPVEVTLPDIRRLYEKHFLDINYINPYFSRIATGDLPLMSISEMREHWLTRGLEESRFTSGRELTSGHDLIYLFNSWYLARFDNQ
jgi:hypothetical protein